MSEQGTYEASPKALDESPVSHSQERHSIDTATNAESHRESVRSANPNGFVRATSGIDVQASEAEFATLQRELSGISQTSRRLSRVQSSGSTKRGGPEKDVEKSGSEEAGSEAEQFDLETTLRGNHAVSYACLLFCFHIENFGRIFVHRNVNLVTIGVCIELGYQNISMPAWTIYLTSTRLKENPASDQSTSA